MRLFLTAAAGAALAALAAHGAQAQSAQEIIERCSATASDADRIACLEAAILADSGDGVDVSQPPGAQADSGAQDGDAQAAARVTAEQMGAEQVAVREGTFNDPVDADSDGEEDAGLRMEATVTRMETDARGMLVVQLDNGQVWRQTRAETFPVRLDMNQPQLIVVTTSGFGGYRMRFLTPNRRIRVERIR